MVDQEAERNAKGVPAGRQSGGRRRTWRTLWGEEEVEKRKERARWRVHIAREPHVALGFPRSSPQKVRSTGSIIRGHVPRTCPRLSAHDIWRQFCHSSVTLVVLWLYVAFDHNIATQRMNTISGSPGFFFLLWGYTMGGLQGWLTFLHLQPHCEPGERLPARLTP